MANLRIISLGWGVQSWTLAAMTALGELEPVDYAIHADTTYEHAGTYAHAKKWAPWLGEQGVKVVTVTARRVDVVREEWANAVSIPAFTTDTQTGARGQVRRQCTHDWKIAPIRQYLRQVMTERGIKATPGAVHSLQGISLDEWTRMRDSDVKYIENVYPLIDARMTRAECKAWLERNHLPVPVKSSCVFCPYKSIPVWKDMKRRGGPDWQVAEAVDANIRDRRASAGNLLYVHPNRKPLSEAVKIPEDEGAQQLELPCDSGFCMT